MILLWIVLAFWYVVIGLIIAAVTRHETRCWWVAGLFWPVYLLIVLCLLLFRKKNDYYL